MSALFLIFCGLTVRQSDLFPCRVLIGSPEFRHHFVRQRSEKSMIPTLSRAVLWGGILENSDEIPCKFCVGEGGGMAALSCQEGFGQASHETPAYAPYYIPGQKITRISVRTEKGTTKYSGKFGLGEIRAGIELVISPIFR